MKNDAPILPVVRYSVWKPTAVRSVVWRPRAAHTAGRYIPELALLPTDMLWFLPMQDSASCRWSR